MHNSYQYNEKRDKPGDWGCRTPEFILRHVYTDSDAGYNRSGSRSIEAQIATTAEIIGKLTELFISKGLIKPEEVVTALELDYHYEVRESI